MTASNQKSKQLRRKNCRSYQSSLHTIIVVQTDWVFRFQWDYMQIVQSCKHLCYWVPPWSLRILNDLSEEEGTVQVWMKPLNPKLLVPYYPILTVMAWHIWWLSIRPSWFQMSKVVLIFPIQSRYNDIIVNVEPNLSLKFWQLIVMHF